MSEKMAQNKKVLIIGGNGFIGTAIANYLKSKKINVVTFDITEPKEKLHKHILGSVMYPEGLHVAMKGCDYVIHLAAMLGVKKTELQRLECLDINIQGTKNVLDAAIKARVKKILFSSSSEVYGEPLKTPISETDRVHPKSVYAVTKLAGEEYCKAYHKEYGLDYTIVRFFNVYGPGQVAEFVMPKFLRAVIDGEDINVNGNGKQTRSFCYVDDIAHGVYSALINKKTSGEIFNIGNDTEPTTMLNLAKTIMEVAGKKTKINFLTEDKADRKNMREIIHRLPDISKAKKILGYKPTISLKKGIDLTIKSGNIPKGWGVLNTRNKIHVK